MFYDGRFIQYMCEAVADYQLSQYWRSLVRNSSMMTMIQVWTKKLSVECNRETWMVRYELPMLLPNGLWWHILINAEHIIQRDSCDWTSIWVIGLQVTYYYLNDDHVVLRNRFPILFYLFSLIAAEYLVDMRLRSCQRKKLKTCHDIWEWWLPRDTGGTRRNCTIVDDGNMWAARTNWGG